MKYRKLGNTGLVVSEIGFGTWGLGGMKNGSMGYGKTRDRESIQALKKAFSLGINFYDTADLYGYGHSEKLLGKTFSSHRDQIILASKVGFLDFTSRQNFSPKHIRQSLAKSLKRLRTSYLDLYQLHSPDVKLLFRNPSILKLLESLREDGLIRAVGISVRSPDEGLQLIRRYPVDCLQVNFNLTDQRALENGLFKQCENQNIGVIVRTPLCFGFLTHASSPKLSKGDHRKRFSSTQLNRWSAACAHFQKEFSNIQGTIAQQALRFCLSFPAVSTVIPGMLHVSHVRENAQASRFSSFSKSKLNRIHKIYQSLKKDLYE